MNATQVGVGFANSNIHGQSRCFCLGSFLTPTYVLGANPRRSVFSVTV